MSDSPASRVAAAALQALQAEYGAAARNGSFRNRSCSAIAFATTITAMRNPLPFSAAPPARVKGSGKIALL